VCPSTRWHSVKLFSCLRSAMPLTIVTERAVACALLSTAVAATATPSNITMIIIAFISFSQPTVRIRVNLKARLQIVLLHPVVELSRYAAGADP